MANPDEIRVMVFWNGMLVGEVDLPHPRINGKVQQICEDDEVSTVFVGPDNTLVGVVTGKVRRW